MKLNLSPAQKKVVDFMDGALLVTAGPGSGKTRVLIERIKNILLSKKRCKVLALTFSNLAAEEMKNRLQEDESIQDYVQNVTVGTIHSFCLEITQKRGNLIGLGNDLILFESNTDREKMLRDIFYRDSELKSILKSQEKPHIYLNNCLNMIAEQKKQFISPEMCETDEKFKKIYIEYNQYLIEQNAIDFDDILFYAYRILSENPSVVNMYTALYRYICIDEAQDLNYAQYQVLKALCGNKFKNIMLVGDENQSIYAFNGSNSDLMVKNFVQDFTPTVYELNENFRSAKAIVAYANKLENTDSISNYFYEGELKAFSLADEQQEAEFILNKLEELKNSGHKDIEGDLKYDDFAIIARNRYVFNQIEQMLQEKRIPYYLKKSASGIDNESDYIKLFDLSMRLLINPKDIIHLRELCHIAKVNVPQNQFDNGIDLVNFIFQDRKYDSIKAALVVLNQEKFEFRKALKCILEYVENTDYFDEEDKYLICSDIHTWEKHWKKYIRQVQSENRTLVSFRNYIALGKTQDISNEKGIALLTVHMSKGLQYEVVFVMGLTEGTFPDYRAVRNGGKEMDQEKNNMFVSATRAKRICYFTYPRIKRMPWGDLKQQQKSRFLNDIEVENI